MRRPNCSLRQLQEKIAQEIERSEREIQESEAHQIPVVQDMVWPTLIHQQHVAQSFAEHQQHLMQNAQIEQAEYEASLQEPPELTPVDTARVQLRTAKSLLIGGSPGIPGKKRRH